MPWNGQCSRGLRSSCGFGWCVMLSSESENRRALVLVGIHPDREVANCRAVTVSCDGVWPLETRSETCLRSSGGVPPARSLSITQVTIRSRTNTCDTVDPDQPHTAVIRSDHPASTPFYRGGKTVVVSASASARQCPQSGDVDPITPVAVCEHGPGQWEKCRSPVTYMDAPAACTAAVTSVSRTDPPGCTKAPTPASSRICTPSANGKNASDAATDPPPPPPGPPPPHPQPTRVTQVNLTHSHTRGGTLEREKNGVRLHGAARSPGKFEIGQRCLIYRFARNECPERCRREAAVGLLHQYPP